MNRVYIGVIVGNKGTYYLGSVYGGYVNAHIYLPAAMFV